MITDRFTEARRLLALRKRDALGDRELRAIDRHTARTKELLEPMYGLLGVKERSTIAGNQIAAILGVTGKSAEREFYHDMDILELTGILTREHKGRDTT